MLRLTSSSVGFGLERPVNNPSPYFLFIPRLSSTTSAILSSNSNGVFLATYQANSLTIVANILGVTSLHRVGRMMRCNTCDHIFQTP